ncbi:hypothetical protein KR51_00010050 [Rubidibacter lacunae KORDI 51-2]|uniref:Diadenylate cyclase n=1 Tax=Rubidibacter lacunae KORDI 51-2 TaxID=582515 RepID=U5DCR4_9CHRO|nr:diadenylate cyclase CdaA [Rubidibacter lacunae]ERN42318.1 hypothetical protein KR51_00010050 [Rubidibacter lacunae KORDI 51-2]
MPPSGSADTTSFAVWFFFALDIGLVTILAFLLLLAIGERSTLWIVRGLLLMLVLLLLGFIGSNFLGLTILPFVLEKAIVGLTVAAALIFQAELRQFLEFLGRGELWQWMQASRRTPTGASDVIGEIVDAVKDLSQNRIGALIVVETGGAFEPHAFSDPGVPLNAEISTELLQTIFQTTTLLHDGAVLIRGSRIAAAGVILPITEKVLSRQLGTRHRAAIGITERSANCLCIVVSEETGSISLAERGNLNRPLTRGKLEELLALRFTPAVELESVAPGLGRLSRQGQALLERLLRLLPPTSHEKK